MRVLVADDDENNRIIIGRILQRNGASFTTVEHGEAAVEEAVKAAGEGKAYDLLFLDLTMPVMGGLEAARRLRALFPGLRMVALTGADETSSLYEAGFVGFLQKPLAITSIGEALARWGPTSSPASS